MDNAEFRFGFKVQGEQAQGGSAQAQVEDDEDVYHSGQEDQDDDDIEAAEADDRFFAEPEPDFWAPYEPSALMPSEELRPGPWRADEAPEQEEIEIAPGLFMLKGRVSSGEAADLIKNPAVTTSDLLPTVYEGGFKLWEGAVDLCHYLLSKYNIDPETFLTDPDLETPLRGKKVLELGCGHGLPGILCLMAGADVHFQDYNKEVLQRLTMPNVSANLARLPAKRPKGSSRYFSGDWHAVGEILTSRGLGGHYDLILTAESIYSVHTQRRLIECIKQVLQPPLGVVLVAAKSHYFGVGGGIQVFKQAVKYDGIFEVQHVYKTTKDVTPAMRAVPPGSRQQQQVQEEGDDAEEEGAAGSSGDKQKAGQDEAGDGGGTAPGSAPAPAAAAETGGNVREVLQLTFPAAILPYFL